MPRDPLPLRVGISHLQSPALFLWFPIPQCDTDHLFSCHLPKYRRFQDFSACWEMGLAGGGILERGRCMVARPLLPAPDPRTHPRVHGCLRARLCGVQPPRGPWAVTGVWGRAVDSGCLWRGEGTVPFYCIVASLHLLRLLQRACVTDTTSPRTLNVGRPDCKGRAFYGSSEGKSPAGDRGQASGQPGPLRWHQALHVDEAPSPEPLLASGRLSECRTA